MKKKITTLLVLACITAAMPSVNAQSWNLTGNTNMTNTSKIGGTSATTAQNFPLRFYTYNAERLHINANTSGKVGYVGIGTTSPAQKLHVVGNATFSGNVGIGITAPTAKLHVIGSTTAGSGITVSGYNNGVEASSTFSGGYGVYGTSPYLGVYGYAPNGTYGTYGYSDYIGAYGSGTTYGVYGYSDAGTAGVYGTSYSSYGVQGESSTNYGGYFTSTDNYAIVASTTNAYYAGVFYGHVYSSSGFVTSDKNLKKDVRDFGDAMSIINKLKPENYLFKDDAKYASLHLPTGRHYGLLAQDLEQVLPNLVSEAPHQLIIDSKPAAVIKPTADGKPQPVVAETKETTETINIKAVNYVELIPIMIKGMQEQEKEIADLKAENQQMKQENEQLKQDMENCCLNHSTASVQDKLQQPASDKALLEQNTPNPFTQQTLVRYYLPAASTAVLKVMSLDGKEMYSAPVTKTGYGELTISAQTLSAGTYTYTLIVDGKAVESKIMVLTK